LTGRGTSENTQSGRRSAVLRKRTEFEALLRSGSRIATPNFVLRACPNALDHARLGIIAGKKAAARAVDRNRAKRLVREAFRAASPSLGAHDIAVQLRNDLRGQQNDALRTELHKLMGAAVRRCVSPGEKQ
jgi:ribonuclease P protein component